MLKNHRPANNPIKQDQRNPPPGLNVMYAIQRQRSPCRSGWFIEATKPTQHQPKPEKATQFSQGNNTPIQLRTRQGMGRELTPTIGINRLAMIGRESTGLSTVRPAIKVR